MFIILLSETPFPTFLQSARILKTVTKNNPPKIKKLENLTPPLTPPPQGRSKRSVPYIFIMLLTDVHVCVECMCPCKCVNVQGLNNSDQCVSSCTCMVLSILFDQTRNYYLYGFLARLSLRLFQITSTYTILSQGTNSPIEPATQRTETTAHRSLRSLA